LVVLLAVGLAGVVGYQLAKRERDEGPEKPEPKQKEQKTKLVGKKNEKATPSVKEALGRGGLAELLDHLKAKGVSLEATASTWRAGGTGGVYLVPTGIKQEGFPFGQDALADVGMYGDWGSNIVHFSRHADFSAARERQILLKGATSFVWGRFLFIGDEKLLNRIKQAMPD
jgi:hypothetical protein